MTSHGHRGRTWPKWLQWNSSFGFKFEYFLLYTTFVTNPCKKIKMQIQVQLVFLATLFGQYSFFWYFFCLFSGALQANSRPGMSFIAFWYAKILHSQLCFLRCIWFGVLKQLLLRRNLIFHWSCSTCLSLNCRMFWDFDFVEFQQPGRHWLHFNFSIGEILRLFSSNESNRYPLHLDCIFI